MLLTNRTGVKNTRDLLRAFGGLNETYGCTEAEYSGGMNFSARDFPALSTRLPRRRLQELAGLNGMYHLNGLLTVCGQDLVYTPDEAPAQPVTVKNAVADSRKTMVGIGTKILIFPDKVAFDTADGSAAPLGAAWEAGSLSVSFAPCDASGNTYEVKDKGTKEPEHPQDGQLFLKLNEPDKPYSAENTLEVYSAVENLLRHQGGFTNRAGDPMFCPIDIAKKMNVPAPADLNTIIKFVLSRRLGFTPGTSTCYSNVGYGILSKVIEKISGKNYEEFIQDSILIPAGCYDMHLAHNLDKDRYFNEVKYYEQSDADLIRSCDGRDTLVYRSNGGNNIEALYGAGGWVASPTELLRFLSAIDANDSYPDILTKESVEIMTKCVKNALPLGWMNTNNQGDWWRSGTLAGTSAMLKRQRDGFCWAFITNTSNWTGPRFPHKIEGMMARAMDRVKEWPDRNLFDPDYCKAFEDGKKLLANEKGVQAHPVHPDNI